MELVTGPDTEFMESFRDKGRVKGVLTNVSRLALPHFVEGLLKKDPTTFLIKGVGNLNVFNSFVEQCCFY